jgi:CBS domain-containing protein
MPTVQAILEHKGAFVHRVAEDATVLDAARTMNDHRVGALVVTRGDKVVGIFTERDILCRVVAVQRDPAATRIDSVMTSPVMVCGPDTTREECRAVMREKRIRHLPVVRDGRLIGLVSIGDMYESTEHDQEQTIHFLYEYMYGEWR